MSDRLVIHAAAVLASILELLFLNKIYIVVLAASEKPPLATEPMANAC